MNKALSPRSPESALSPESVASRRGHNPALGLYVHIPFCVKKCFYCDFESGPVGLALRRRHLAALQSEIVGSRWNGFPGRSIFLGGGTPSELSIPELERIAAALQTSFDLENLVEWTIECNPGTVRPEKLAVLAALGINRISLGVQSFDDQHLEALGRIHNAREAREAFNWVREAGFRNVNFDLMFALPGQSLAEWRRDLEEALELAPEHLSLYNLTIESGTEFGRRRASGELSEFDEETAARMFELAMDLTTGAGYEHYEISNYARPGCRSLHNQIYWRNEPSLGFGISASSYMEGVRWTNTHSFEAYAAGVAAGSVPRQVEEHLSRARALGEEIMLGLRTSDGISLDELTRRHSFELKSSFREDLAFFQRQGLMERQDDRFRLTRSGRLVADQICLAFLEPPASSSREIPGGFRQD